MIIKNISGKDRFFGYLGKVGMWIRNNETEDVPDETTLIPQFRSDKDNSVIEIISYNDNDYDYVVQKEMEDIVSESTFWEEESPAVIKNKSIIDTINIYGETKKKTNNYNGALVYDIIEKELDLSTGSVLQTNIPTSIILGIQSLNVTQIIGSGGATTYSLKRYTYTGPPETLVPSVTFNQGKYIDLIYSGKENFDAGADIGVVPDTGSIDSGTIAVAVYIIKLESMSTT